MKKNPKINKYEMPNKHSDLWEKGRWQILMILVISIQIQFRFKNDEIKIFSAVHLFYRSLDLDFLWLVLI